jgi:hypothetical protein
MFLRLLGAVLSLWSFGDSPTYGDVDTMLHGG